MRLCILMLILSCFFLPLSLGENSITPHNSITRNQTLISAGGNFALGFFSPGNSTNTYLGIWFNTIPKQTVVWVANRNSPLSKSLQISLTISHNGNLVLSNSEKQPIWSTNALSTKTNTTVVAVLLDTGNIILKDSDNMVLWDSSDFPSDTLLPGMKISLNRIVGKEKRSKLVSWANSEDPQEGIFSIGIDTKALQFYMTKNDKMYWRSNVYANTLSYTTGYNKSVGVAVYITYVVDGNNVYLKYGVSDSSINLRLVVIPSGKLELVRWVESRWVVMWAAPVYECDFYSRCGPFGSCKRDKSPSLCECLRGFEPKNKKDWSRGDYSSGCVRVEGLSCGSRDEFVKNQKMKLPDHSISLGNMSLNECQIMCMRNCSCTAYAYANASEEISIKCLYWFGNLVDMVYNYYTGQDLYVRLHGYDSSEIGTKKDSKKSSAKSISLIVGFSSMVTIVLIFICILCYVLRRKRLRRRQGTIRGSFPGINSMSSVQSDSELLSVSLRSILAATDNFSEENKLGEGGFGPVYKGYFHENQEIAIKRLSKKSLQGLEEFMNELKLIAKLQHTNLVKLLGCCVEEDEMMLMYEYMPNKSLDNFIFDHLEQANLIWSKRFRIIEGIAQGLLYLHKYSRLKVIHRDLKASNVLLDQEMTPKISDFGMARIVGLSQTETNTKRVVGTYGYMAPEYALYGQFSEKSDVFSFGVLLLEIVSGKKNTDFHRTGLALTLLGWVWENCKEGRISESIDPSIRCTCQLNEAARCINVGLLCVQEVPSDRPTMSDVVIMLSNENVVVRLPKEPAFSTRKSSIATAAVASSSQSEMTISAIDPR